MEAFYILPDGPGNTKTGPIVQQYVGTTKEQSRASCNGCFLLETKQCYAHFGTPAWAFASMVRAWKSGKSYSLRLALRAAAKRKSKYVRLGALGDPSAVTGIHRHIARIRKAGLGILAYTQFWGWTPELSKGEDLRGEVLASCDTWVQSKKAVAEGWRVYLHVTRDWIVEHGPQGTFDGMTYTLCPAQRGAKSPFPMPSGKVIQCIDCGLCDAKNPTRVDVTLAIDHGPMDRG